MTFASGCLLLRIKTNELVIIDLLLILTADLKSCFYSQGPITVNL